MTKTSQDQKLAVRALAPADLDEVIRIDAMHRGAADRAYWESVLERFLLASRARRGGKRGPAAPPTPVALGVGAAAGGPLAGFLFGEVRATEFGSETCGWIFAVGVDRRRFREGVASALLAAACRRFARAGVSRVRTMVRRADVPVLSFFRSQRFVGGPFVQLELPLDAQEDKP